MSKGKYSIVVDAYSSGNQLALHLKRYGYQVIHVQSTERIPRIFKSSYRSEDFEDNLIYTGNYHDLVKKLKVYTPEFIIAGSELGVEMADHLSVTLNLTRNEETLTLARRDKFEMIEQLNRHGVTTTNQIKSSNCQEIIEWSKNQKKWPIVLKPLNSAGSENVFFCYSIKEVEKAFSTTFNKVNYLGIQNDSILAQTYINGQQYIVNSVSVEGSHYISDIWKDHTRLVDDSSVIIDHVSLLHSEGTLQYKIKNYVENVLTVLGIRNGAAHTEVIFNNEEGPVIVETGARTAGLVTNQDVLIDVLGYSHSSLTVESYVDPKKFKKRIKSPYSINRNLSVLFLAAQRRGVIKNCEGLKKLQHLPTYHSCDTVLEENMAIDKTTDSTTHPGYVYLVHKSEQTIKQDQRFIRNLERSGQLYKIVPSSTDYVSI